MFAIIVLYARGEGPPSRHACHACHSPLVCHCLLLPLAAVPMPLPSCSCQEPPSFATFPMPLPSCLSPFRIPEGEDEGRILPSFTFAAPPSFATVSMPSRHVHSRLHTRIFLPPSPCPFPRACRRSAWWRGTDSSPLTFTAVSHTRGGGDPRPLAFTAHARGVILLPSCIQMANKRESSSPRVRHLFHAQGVENLNIYIILLFLFLCKLLIMGDG